MFRMEGVMFGGVKILIMIRKGKGVAHWGKRFCKSRQRVILGVLKPTLQPETPVFLSTGNYALKFCHSDLANNLLTLPDPVFLSYPQPFKTLNLHLGLTQSARALIYVSHEVDLTSSQSSQCLGSHCG